MEDIKREPGLFWSLCNSIAVAAILTVSYNGQVIVLHIVQLWTAQITIIIYCTRR